MEIADLLVVNKADLPDAARTATHLKAMLHHRGHDERRSMLSVSTLNQDGLKALGDAIDARFAGLPSGPSDVAVEGKISRSTLAQDVAEAAAALVLGTSDPRLTAILENMSQGKLSRHEGAAAALAMLTDLDAI